MGVRVIPVVGPGVVEAGGFGTEATEVGLGMED